MVERVPHISAIPPSPTSRDLHIQRWITAKLREKEEAIDTPFKEIPKAGEKVDLATG